jgi:1-acyl-sn-glycerol-3-phosphate acyltransferase
MLKKIVLYFVLFFWFLFWAPFLFIGLINVSLERKISVFIAKYTLVMIRWVAGIKYELHYPMTNENGIPFKHNINTRLDGRAIIASKHMSALETIILFRHIPNAFFIIKRELLWIPFYGWAFARLGFIGVNRKRGATNMKKMTANVMKKIMNSMTLIIFPEGTRVAPNQKISLKRGLLFLASELKLPIMPVGVDTGLYWPKKGKIKSGTTHIYFENELPSTASLEEIQEAINKHSC